MMKIMKKIKNILNNMRSCENINFCSKKLRYKFDKSKKSITEISG